MSRRNSRAAAARKKSSPAPAAKSRSAGARKSTGPTKTPAPQASASGKSRVEQDPLGSREVPADALYGVQTVRAIENFPISGLRPLPAFVVATVRIKKAAALTHRETGRLDRRLADAIIRAADEILDGKHRDQFVVDVYQAGAGTSHNMNTNEVLANRANELLGSARGTYSPVHPNDHVNMAQSTNDVIPTAIRLACLAELNGLTTACSSLATALRAKGSEFDGVLKSGRTHLQDAMPIRLGQEFTAYAGTIERCLRRIEESADYLRDLGIGGSAVGTGVNVEPEYPALIVKHLREICGFEVRVGQDRIQLMQSLGDVAAFSAQLRVLAIDLSKICNDLRLLASGPRTGLDEIRLPEVQPGSSIMPGKINPSIPEMVNQVCLQVMGTDTTVSAAAEHGQLELNVMMPVVAFNVLLAETILANAMRSLTERCIKGIAPNRDMCEYWLERSAALATALAPQIGYKRAAELSKQSVKDNILIRALVKREQVLPPDQIDEVLDLRKMTEIGVPGGSHGGVSAG